jgi:hypothetical protein
VLIIALLGIVIPSVYYKSIETVKITIVDKEKVVNIETHESKYLIYTKSETFQNTDDLLLMKFNSSDIQGSLRTDSNYTVQVIGWRVPFLSMHRNIIKIIKNE